MGKRAKGEPDFIMVTIWLQNVTWNFYFRYDKFGCYLLHYSLSYCIMVVSCGAKWGKVGDFPYFTEIFRL